MLLINVLLGQLGPSAGLIQMTSKQGKCEDLGLNGGGILVEPLGGSFQVFALTMQCHHLLLLDGA